jgi:hypothetical protein
MLGRSDREEVVASERSRRRRRRGRIGKIGISRRLE